jgi:cytochrome c553
MKRLDVSVILGVFIVVFATVSAAFAAYRHAGEADAPNFLAAYPDKAGTKLDNCTLCHTGGSYTSSGKTTTLGSCQWCHYKYGYDKSGDITATLNLYGKDYLAQGRNVAAFKTIETLDSDADGFTNIAEINAVRYPGDATDDPTKIVAPFRIYTKAQLQAMPQHSQFMLMNTTKSGDYYATYSGVVMQDLLNTAGITANATKITVYAPDGFSVGHPLADSSSNTGSSYAPFVNGTYPPATYYYDATADKAVSGSSGWCDYTSPGAAGRKNGDPITNPNGLKLILALQAEGKDLVPGVLDSTNKLSSTSEGPFRTITPQKVVGPPDQASTATNQNVIWPYSANNDHNAGFASKCATIIKVEPLPAGTTDINVLESGWNYIDQGKIVIYGALARLRGFNSLDKLFNFF